ncbi:tyrosine-type recombinase/integrase [Comamonas sp. 26]|uniref:tyrosine-type recombinase/integrase n=1 Tax=Comamonas sp. 26 TaxID=2035201 RepID=UPI000C19F6EC
MSCVCGQESEGGEICALHASHIENDEGFLWATLLKSQTKNKKRDRATDFRIPLVVRAAEVVRRRLQESPEGYLFLGKHASGHIQQTNVQTQVHSKQPYSRTRPDWERERLTVTHWLPHDLRRTARTLLARLSCPEDVGEAVLGHMIPGVAGIYNRHKYDSEKLQWLQTLAKRLFHCSACWDKKWSQWFEQLNPVPKRGPRDYAACIGANGNAAKYTSSGVAWCTYFAIPQRAARTLS